MLVQLEPRCRWPAYPVPLAAKCKSGDSLFKLVKTQSERLGIAVVDSFLGDVYEV
jgi:hypothetical protein